MSRVFLMKWYHFSVEYFEDLRNINHCEFLIMNKQPSGKYVLENKLRTWSELRRERALKKEKEKEKGTGTPTSKDSNKLDKALVNSASPIVAPRRWGGCPNGCTHDKSFRIRSALADLVKRDGTSMHPNPTTNPSPSSALPNNVSTPNSAASSLTTHGIATPPTTNGTSTPSSSLGLRRQAARRFQSEDEDSCSDCEQPETGGAASAGGSNNKPRAPHIDVTRAREEIVSSPDGTPSFISVDDRLRARDMKSPPAHPLAARGRDFGGSYSGQNSLANSDADSSEDERRRLQRRRLLAATKMGAEPAATGLKVVTEGIVNVHLKVGDDVGPSGGAGGKRDQSGMGRNTMANRLGDSPVSSDSGCCEQHDHEEHADDERDKAGATDEADDLSDIDKEEKQDRSIKGSVY